MVTRRGLLLAGGIAASAASAGLAQSLLRYPVPDGATEHDAFAPFADPNLKLAVLSGLLDIGALDLGEPWDLAAHVLQRPWDYEAEGYDLVPEALDYLYCYPLTEGLLARAEHLFLDGGNAIYPYAWYFWGGEEDLFDVSSFAGLTACPNLRTIEVNAMTKGLIDLRGLNRLADIYLSGRFGHLEALLDLPALRELRLHKSDIDQTVTPDHAVGSILDTLADRGVSVTVY